MNIPGLDKYRPQAEARPEDKFVALANEQVRIEDVINQHFSPDLEIPYATTSWKTSCPFAFEHEDFGFEKQFRVYSETNSCHCFKMHGYMTPVDLWMAKSPGLTRRQAAIDLLETYGIETKTKDWRQRFRDTQAESTAEFDSMPVKRAFQVMLHNLPDYGKRQFEGDVITDVDTILSEIEDKVPQFETLRDLEIWFKAVKDTFKERYVRSSRPREAQIPPEGG